VREVGGDCAHRGTRGPGGCGAGSPHRCGRAGATAGGVRRSRRVYLISLTGWAWPLVGRPIPLGSERRRAVPPIVPLALLDAPGAGTRLAAAVTQRAGGAGPRTVSRELSALRSAVGWWLDRDWISGDPTARLGPPGRLPAPVPPLSAEQVRALFHRTPGLREHAFWRVLYDSRAGAQEVLRLDVGDLDLRNHRARPRRAAAWGQPIRWREDTSELLRWLTTGRPAGPVFLTGRRAPRGSGHGQVCPVTGRGRMSYRRAAEIFTAASQPLDPAGEGWTLHQLSTAVHAQGSAG
jgi:integrase